MSAVIDGKSLAELSDAELRTEAERRRRKRGKQGGRVDPVKGNLRPSATLDLTVKRAFKNLEIAETATRDETEAAYHRLIEKYDPEKRRENREKYEAAVNLSRQLSRSYRTIIRYFENKS